MRSFLGLDDAIVSGGTCTCGFSDNEAAIGGKIPRPREWEGFEDVLGDYNFG